MPAYKRVCPRYKAPHNFIARNATRPLFDQSPKAIACLQGEILVPRTLFSLSTLYAVLIVRISSEEFRIPF